MKVIVTKYLNVRMGKPSLNAPCYQYLAPGSELKVDGKIYHGDEYNGIKDWLKDEAGNYYWSGGVEMQGHFEERPTSPSYQSFQWLKSLGIDKIWGTYKEYGTNSTVAVLDTGYDINNSFLPEPLSTEIFVKSKTGITTIQDNKGHGTFCTSLIAANNPLTKIGIAPHCKLLIGKVSHGGEVEFDNLLNGIAWAVESGADVISISIGKSLNDLNDVIELQDKYNEIIRNRNILVLAACANSHSGEVITGESYPASLKNCNSIGTIKDDVLHNITVRSDKTILHTIGIDIEGYSLNNVLERQSGTSMSTAIISGIMALAISFQKKIKGHWDKDELISKLIESGNTIEGYPDKKIVNPLKFFQLLKN